MKSHCIYCDLLYSFSIVFMRFIHDVIAYSFSQLYSIALYDYSIYIFNPFSYQWFFGLLVIIVFVNDAAMNILGSTWWESFSG